MRITLDQHAADPAADQTQARELRRVSGALARLVYDFCDWKLYAASSVEFTLQDLERWVSDRTATTPGSAGRILRMLNRTRAIAYSCIDRRSSRYRIDAIDPSKRPIA